MSSTSVLRRAAAAARGLDRLIRRHRGVPPPGDEVFRPPFRAASSWSGHRRCSQCPGPSPAPQRARRHAIGPASRRSPTPLGSRTTSAPRRGRRTRRWAAAPRSPACASSPLSHPVRHANRARQRRQSGLVCEPTRPPRATPRSCERVSRCGKARGDRRVGQPTSRFRGPPRGEVAAKRRRAGAGRAAAAGRARIGFAAVSRRPAGQVFGAIHLPTTPSAGSRMPPSLGLGCLLADPHHCPCAHARCPADELAAVIGFPTAARSFRPRLRRESDAAARPRRTNARPLPGRDRDGARWTLGVRSRATLTAPTGAGSRCSWSTWSCRRLRRRSRRRVGRDKGDLCRDLTDLVPADRRDDVLIFDLAATVAASTSWPVGDVTADLITDPSSASSGVYAGFLGRRSRCCFGCVADALAGLATDDLPRSCRCSPTKPSGGELMGAVSDDELAATWAWSRTSDAARAGWSPVANKFASFTLRRKLRRSSARALRPTSTRHSASARMILVSPREGLGRRRAARLIGSCILAELSATISAVPPSRSQRRLPR